MQSVWFICMDLEVILGGGEIEITECDSFHNQVLPQRRFPIVPRGLTSILRERLTLFVEILNLLQSI